MKKSLIALAVAGVVAAPAAFAATGNVDVYGQARISMDKTEGSNLTLNDRVSRVGIKGSEDLGGGLAAIWGMEWGVSLSANSGLGGRNAFVGLKGDFGTVLAGQHDTPYKLAGSADVFGDTAADAATGNATGNTGIIGRAGAASFDLRAKNALAYISPTWSGFHFAAAVTNNASATEDITAAQSLALVYGNGPLLVTFGYEDHGDLADEDAMKLTGKYTIGDLGLAATYEQRTVATVDMNAYLVSGTYGIGPITLALQYGNAETSATDDLTRTTLGAIYTMSKRTNAYVAYNLDDDSTAADTVNTVTVGLNHSF